MILILPRRQSRSLRSALAPSAVCLLLAVVAPLAQAEDHVCGEPARLLPDEEGGWGPVWLRGAEVLTIEVIPFNDTVDHAVEVRLSTGAEPVEWSEGLVEVGADGRILLPVATPGNIGRTIASLSVLVTASNPLTGEPIAKAKTERLLVHRDPDGAVVEVTPEDLESTRSSLAVQGIQDGVVEGSPIGWEVIR